MCKKFNADKAMDKVELYLLAGMKYSAGLLIAGQAIMGIMSLI